MATAGTAERPKILLVDDDQDFLEVYREILQRLPSAPEIFTAPTGTRALALLDSQPFDMMVVDLHMPRMDGLQVLSVARRKHPLLRIVVLTAVRDEEFRLRAYSMGVDQFWLKPETEREIQMLMDSIEALWRRNNGAGFRGVQSKSLVDILQLESLAQTSGLLRITNGSLEGRIWMHNGAVVDAEAQELQSEAALRRILSWKGGSFEMLPPDPGRPRQIFASIDALLLEYAQAYDEARGAPEEPGEPGEPAQPASALARLPRLDSVQFALCVGARSNGKTEAWGVEAPEQVAAWTSQALEGFGAIGERLHLGQVQQVRGTGSLGHVTMARGAEGDLTVGFRAGLGSNEVHDQMKNLLAQWDS
jgi:DNA-binding response OmpR family regulator